MLNNIRFEKSNDSCKHQTNMGLSENSVFTVSKDQILIDRFADLMIDRLFQDIDNDKKLYTKLQ